MCHFPYNKSVIIVRKKSAWGTYSVFLLNNLEHSKINIKYVIVKWQVIPHHWCFKEDLIFTLPSSMIRCLGFSETVYNCPTHLKDQHIYYTFQWRSATDAKKWNRKSKLSLKIKFSKTRRTPSLSKSILRFKNLTDFILLLNFYQQHKKGTSRCIMFHARSTYIIIHKKINLTLYFAQKLCSNYN
jgi:hypothetical protein